MSGYQFYLFGAPRLENQSQLVSIDTRKALALLAYLLLNGEPQNRDTLASFLWPESSQKSARAALRRTLSTLRSALDEKLLDFGREIIAIHPGNELWCDVMTFHSLLNETGDHGHLSEQSCERCLAPLEKAAELYTADFMAGFSLRDSSAFDDWQFFETERLRRELGGVLERLVRIYGDKADFQAAIDSARRWSALDLLNEAAHRALILLYAQSGQRNAALRQYRECVRILDQELGVPPLEETTQLYEAVKENRLDKLGITPEQTSSDSQVLLKADQQPQGIERPSFPAEFPPIGRTSEGEELIRLYEGIEQNGIFTALTGDIGIGKSHLAQAFIKHLESRGAIALSARCFAGESNLAYMSLIDLLRQGINQAEENTWWQGLNPLWISETALLIPEISEIVPDLPQQQLGTDPGAQNRFYEAVCQVLTALVSGPATGIIFIDDLEWVDESTLELLAYFARRLKSRPVFLLAAWRSESSSTTGALNQILKDAVQQGHGFHISLSDLDQTKANELIDHLTPKDQKYSPTIKDKLVELSSGLPYIMVEYLQAAQRGEISSQLDAEDWPVPTGLRELLQKRLEGLSGSAFQILQTAAVIGRTFNIELLQSASGRSEDEIIQGIEELLAHNLVLEILDQTGNGLPAVRFGFNHQQVRDMVLEDLSLVRLRLLHRRTAEALEDQQRMNKRQSLNGQIAYHYQQSGFYEKAAEHYFQAGQQDRSLYANADALTHFNAAIALGYPKKPEIMIELGDLYTLKGDYPQAIQHFETAAAYDLPALLPTIEQKIGQVYLRLGQWEQAACHFEAALFDLSAFQPEERNSFKARVHADLSLSYHHRGQTERAASLADQALVLAKAGDDPLAMAQTQNLLGILARSTQDYEGAEKHLELSLSFAQRLENSQGQVAALNNLALVQADLGDLQAAIETIQRAIDESLVIGDRHLEAALRSNYADILRADERLETAMEQLKQAAAIFADIGQNVEDWQPEIWKLVEW